ncbi:MAG: hypothetical protein M5U26_10280 [Planctomycetota bacterium]|nr:hypothetical protein [Planctomycetota bacterium]
MPRPRAVLPVDQFAELLGLKRPLLDQDLSDALVKTLGDERLLLAQRGLELNVRNKALV